MSASQCVNNSQHTPRSFTTQKPRHIPEHASPDETLFRTLISDPNKRALVLQLLSAEQYCSTPIRSNSQVSVGGERSNTMEVNNSVLSPISVSGVLRKTVAYVELRNKEGVDRSTGAKALMRSLGATVRDTFTNDVTHVIFKDGSFGTYLKAKQNNIHLVSVLWLEAVRKANMHVSEKEYPALGTSAYDVNITEMCKDYEDLVYDELLLAKSQPLPKIRKKIGLPPEPISPDSNSFTTPEHLSDITIHDGEAEPYDIASDRLSNSSPELTSDNDSDCGVINGRSAKRNKNLQEINLNNNDVELKQLGIQRFSNSSSNPSISLLAMNSKQTTMNETVNMDLTCVKDKENTPKIRLQKSKQPIKPIQRLPKDKTITRAQSVTLDKRCSEDEQKNTKFKSSSDSAIIKGYVGTNLVHSETIPSLRISSNSSKNSSSRSTRNSARVSVDSLNLNHSLTPPKKRTRLKPNTNDLKKLKVVENGEAMDSLKRTSGSESFPSLRISAESTVVEPNKHPNVNIISNILLDKDDLRSTNSSLINRLSRMAIRGSTDTVNKSNDGSDNIQNVSSLSYSSKGSDHSFSPVSSPKETPQENTSLRSSSKESRTLEKPSNTKQFPKKNLRKLYNPNQSINEQHKQWVQEENRKAYNIPNKQLVVSLVPVAPIFLTPKAKNFLKFLGRNEKTKLEKEKGGKQTPKAKKKTTKKTVTTKKGAHANKAAVSNGENDEQTELIKELVNPEKRKSLRIIEQANKSSNNRRSTLDFVITPRTKARNIFVQSNRKIKPSIVCTRFHKPDVLLFMQIVRKLGTFFVEDEVSNKTTHLIVGETGRTINLLRAIARGCWILNQEWLLRSLEEGEWLPEEDYEFTEFSPAVQQCRQHRQAFGRTYTMDIFENCGPIYIVRSSNPRRSDLEELVELCKGTISNSANKAAIVIGEWVRYDVICVSEQWILDSIACNKRKSFKKYLLH